MKYLAQGSLYACSSDLGQKWMEGPLLGGQAVGPPAMRGSFPGKSELAFILKGTMSGT